jgi:hypothetical protein
VRAYQRRLARLRKGDYRVSMPRRAPAREPVLV